MATDTVTGLPIAGPYILPSETEIRVLAAIVERHGRKGAAQLLRISEHTINAHQRHMFDTTGRTTHGAIYLGGRDGWLPVPRLEAVALDPRYSALELLELRRRILERLRQLT